MCASAATSASPASSIVGARAPPRSRSSRSTNACTAASTPHGPPARWRMNAGEPSRKQKPAIQGGGKSNSPPRMTLCML
ncbi:hypothetical protein AB1Y20_010499 [Prymnesium parvum]|uniref:Uncharacterized protein n=1 Tax=Prymnesium parvum TaxID=97485 RepID=A0AB34IRK0_PRYPA